MAAVKELVLLDRYWLPTSEGTAIYIRPTMIATEAALGVQPSDTYLFFIVLSPVGPYYKEGFNPTRIFVSEEYIRAARGGVGNTKTSGNYGPTLYVSEEAKARGYTQVLWLDAVERRYVEEVGTSNIFFVIDDELVTPSLSGSILSGVTRDSVMQVASSWDIQVTERRVSMEEVAEGCRSGKITRGIRYRHRGCRVAHRRDRLQGRGHPRRRGRDRPIGPTPLRRDSRNPVRLQGRPLRLARANSLAAIRRQRTSTDT